MRELKTTTCLLILIAISCASPVWADARDVMLVLDNSGSMRKNDPEFLARGAVGSFVEQLDEETRAGIIIFDHRVNLAVPLTAVNAESRASMVASLGDINYRGQLTDSPAAVERAIYELKTNGRADAAKFIVFITDGIVDTGNADADIEKTKWLREELAVDAADNDIKVYAIAFTENADFFLIQSLAKKTNGEYFRALNPSDLAGVFATVHEKLTAAPESKPVTVVVEPAPEPTTAASGAVITPVPDDTVAAVPITDETDPGALLASLSEDERLALEDISAQTGVPVEQLALELVGPSPEGDQREIQPGKAIITYPQDELSPEEERAGLMLLAAAAAILLLIVGVAVWLLMRKRKPAATASQPAASAAPAAVAAVDEGAIPEAFINDTHGYGDEPSTRLGEKPLMIGRVAGTDTQHLDYLVINQGTVGRRHAIIKYKDFTFWIVDQGSVNGTFVNGERLVGERQLKHGDTLRFHKYDFQFSQPEMDDGAHTVFADPNMADATVVASAETMATAMMEATAAQEAPAEEAAPAEIPAVAPSASDVDDLFDITDDAVPAVDESPAAAFADSDVFDITGETDMPDEESAAQAAGDEEAESEATVFFDSPADSSDGEADDDDFDEEATALFDSPVVEDDEPAATPTSEAPPVEEEDDDDAPVTGEYFNDEEEDDEDLGVEINLDAVGADDHPSLILNSAPNTSEPDFDAEASAFFEDITVGPTPDDETGPAPDAGGDDIFDITDGEESQSDLDAKLERAAALMDDDDDEPTVVLNPGKTPGDPNDVTLDDFIQTDSFDAPATIPPAMPKQDSSDEGDATLEAFMDTAIFEGGKVDLTNEDKTMLPDQVPDDPRKDANMGDTVILDTSAPPDEKGDDDDDDDDVGSEDPTVLR